MNKYKPAAMLQKLKALKLPCDWNHRIRDGIIYAIGSVGTVALLFNAGIWGFLLIYVWWFLTAQACKRFFPEFLDDADYAAFKIRQAEKKERDRGL